MSDLASYLVQKCLNWQSTLFSMAQCELARSNKGLRHGHNVFRNKTSTTLQGLRNL